ncbi:NAD(P)/FAD-dependent oxidoreductase [Salmonella enterica]|uniref:Oxidoreductase n=2 Tax=Salmonella enterica TaxID=28901 RepID=A0A379QE04_SALER|nr:FAD-dependent oxidoreductase [Salmonella enterica]ECC1480910.1 NAD(P)/FAD-dependent oxidoreductase [Salmonella enterica subsp. salamae]ASG86309.1 FAD-dependent oxidoreductase [Salmonella enterica subsp. salamae serovar 55:k:z39 str. 1315K]ECC1654460.1 NAD(P)/FAD-dependent oxidoreductase [Salmonella enterica subsp. salamae]ECC1692036.1 NAD(P)/FAD-dependent oxidoreductase [Salmonella enterica subsp. salamae]ECD9412907.1 NAD(P)/FAD-dependent oxidoreductase [Salmonella enterica subsp. salamae]
MHKDILIVGAGFSGMWAALSAARLVDKYQREDIKITVIAPQPELRVRPRFYENEVTTLVAPLQPLFDITGVNFLRGTVRQIFPDSKEVSWTDASGETRVSRYDRLVLASGSHVDRSQVIGAQEHAFDLDQLESAAVLEQHLKDLAYQAESEARNTVVVCGGGFTGIEMALELPGRLRNILGADAKTRVVVVERSPEPGARYSEALRNVIIEASAELGVEWLVNAEVESVDAAGVTLKDGRTIASQTVIWTVGVQANDLTAQIDAPRDRQGRLHVNTALQVSGHEDIYATGDVAYAATDDKGHHALMTCQHAILLGKFAGNNAAASLLEVTPLPYRQENYVTCLDLGAWGAVYTEGWDQQVKLTRAEAKKLKMSITGELIYPPKADRTAAFEIADPLAPFV